MDRLLNKHSKIYPTGTDQNNSYRYSRPLCVIFNIFDIVLSIA